MNVLRFQRTAALLVAAVLLTASPVRAQDEGAEQAFTSESRAEIEGGNIDAARAAAIEGALTNIFARALRSTAASVGAADRFRDLYKSFQKRRDEFIVGYRLNSEIPTATEYLVSVKGVVNTRQLERAVRHAGFGPATVAAVTGEQRPIEIHFRGVASFDQLQALRTLLGRDAPGLAGAELAAVKGRDVRFRGRYAGQPERLAGWLSGRSVADAVLRTHTTTGESIVMTVTK